MLLNQISCVVCQRHLLLTKLVQLLLIKLELRHQLLIFLDHRKITGQQQSGRDQVFASAQVESHLLHTGLLQLLLIQLELRHKLLVFLDCGRKDARVQAATQRSRGTSRESEDGGRCWNQAWQSWMTGKQWGVARGNDPLLVRASCTCPEATGLTVHSTSVL